MDGKLCNEQNGLVLTKMHEDLCSVLNTMDRLTTFRLSPAEQDQVVCYTVKIRYLLADLERMQFWSQDNAIGRSLSGVARRFLELEGILKEQRNDRLRAGKRPDREKA